jgi:hypothetical protein
VFCNGELAADEGKPVPIDPFHALPYVYGPGSQENGRKDLYPSHSYPWWEGFNTHRNPDRG